MVARRSCGQCGTDPGASSPSAAIVSSACAQARRYSPVRYSVGSSGPAHMSASSQTDPSAYQARVSGAGRPNDSPR